MKTLKVTVIVAFGIMCALLGAVVDAKAVFPTIKAQIRDEGFRAGMQAQADYICQYITEGRLLRPVLTADGLLVACDRGPEVG